MALTKAAVVIANNVTLGASTGTIVSADQDISAAYQSVLLLKFINGGIGPTVQAQCQVDVAEDTTNYMALATAYGSTSSGVTTIIPIEIPAPIQQMRLQYGSNTGQAVTFRAVLHKVTGL